MADSFKNNKVEPAHPFAGQLSARSLLEKARAFSAQTMHLNLHDFRVAEEVKSKSQTQFDDIMKGISQTAAVFDEMQACYQLALVYQRGDNFKAQQMDAISNELAVAILKHLLACAQSPEQKIKAAMDQVRSYAPTMRQLISLKLPLLAHVPHPYKIKDLHNTMIIEFQRTNSKELELLDQNDFRAQSSRDVGKMEKETAPTPNVSDKLVTVSVRTNAELTDAQKATINSTMQEAVKRLNDAQQEKFAKRPRVEEIPVRTPQPQLFVPTPTPYAALVQSIETRFKDIERQLSDIHSLTRPALEKEIQDLDEDVLQMQLVSKSILGGSASLYEMIYKVMKLEDSRKLEYLALLERIRQKDLQELQRPIANKPKRKLFFHSQMQAFKTLQSGTIDIGPNALLLGNAAIAEAKKANSTLSGFSELMKRFEADVCSIKASVMSAYANFDGVTKAISVIETIIGFMLNAYLVATAKSLTQAVIIFTAFLTTHGWLSTFGSAIAACVSALRGLSNSEHDNDQEEATELANVFTENRLRDIAPDFKAQSKNPTEAAQTLFTLMVEIIKKAVGVPVELSKKHINFKNIKNFSTLVHGMKSVSVLADMAKASIEYVRVDILGLPSSDAELQLTIEKIKTWVQKCAIELPADVQRKVLLSKNYALDIGRLIKEGTFLRGEIANYKEGFPPTILATFNSTLISIIKFKDALDAKLREDNGRIEPLVCYMYSEPGRGKSVAAYMLGLFLYWRLYPEKIKDFRVSDQVYQYKSGRKYWDDYFGQWMCVLDDVYQSTVIEDRTQVSLDIIGLKNDATMTVPMAELADKKGAYFTSRLLMLTNNNYYKGLGQINIEDLGALFRRFDLAVEVGVYPEFLTMRNGIKTLNKNLVKEKFPDEIIPTKHWYFVVEGYIGPRMVTLPDGKVVPGVYDFDGMVDILYQRYKELEAGENSVAARINEIASLGSNVRGGKEQSSEPSTPILSSSGTYEYTSSDDDESITKVVEFSQDEIRKIHAERQATFVVEPTKTKGESKPFKINKRGGTRVYEKKGKFTKQAFNTSSSTYYLCDNNIESDANDCWCSFTTGIWDDLGVYATGAKKWRSVNFGAHSPDDLVNTPEDHWIRVGTAICSVEDHYNDDCALEEALAGHGDFEMQWDMTAISNLPEGGIFIGKGVRCIDRQQVAAYVIPRDFQRVYDAWVKMCDLTARHIPGKLSDNVQQCSNFLLDTYLNVDDDSIIDEIAATFKPEIQKLFQKYRHQKLELTGFRAQMWKWVTDKVWGTSQPEDPVAEAQKLLQKLDVAALGKEIQEITKPTEDGKTVDERISERKSQAAAPVVSYGSLDDEIPLIRKNEELRTVNQAEKAVLKSTISQAQMLHEELTENYGPLEENLLTELEKMLNDYEPGHLQENQFVDLYTRVLEDDLLPMALKTFILRQALYKKRTQFHLPIDRASFMTWFYEMLTKNESRAIMRASFKTQATLFKYKDKCVTYISDTYLDACNAIKRATHGFTSWLSDSRNWFMEKMDAIHKKYPWVKILEIAAFAIGIIGTGFFLFSLFGGNKNNEFESQAAFGSGDPKTHRVNYKKVFVRKNVRGAPVTLQDLHAQSLRDHGGVNLLNSLVLNNMGSIYWANDAGQTCFMTGITFTHGTTGLTVQHFTSYKPEGFNKIRLSCKKGILDFDLREVKVINHGEDLAMLIFPTRLSSFPDIRKHFMKISDSTIDLSQLAFATRTSAGGLIYVSCGSAHLGKSISYRLDPTGNPDLRVYLDGYIRADVPSQDGDCGFPFVVLNTKLEKKICGILVAGDGREALAHLVDPAILYEDQAMFTAQSKGLTLPVGTTKVENVPASEAPRVPHRSVIQPSLIAPYVGYESTTRPAQLAPFQNADGEWISPLQNGINKMARPEIILSERVKKVIDQAADQVFLELPAARGGSFAKLTPFEAINGRPSSQHTESIYFSTSYGYHYKKPAPPGKSTKKFYFICTCCGEQPSCACFDDRRTCAGHGPSYKPTAELQRAVDDLRDLAKNRVLTIEEKRKRARIIFQDCLKDERRKHDKVNAGKTRLFSAGPTELLLVMRELYQPFIEMMMSDPTGSFSAMGINPNSQQWKMLYERLTRFGLENTKCLPGDFADFDASLRAYINQQIKTRIIEPWFRAHSDWDDDDFVAHDFLWDVVYRPEHIAANLIYQVDESGINPSGQLMTTAYNIIYNAIAHCSSAVLCAQDESKPGVHGEYCPEDYFREFAVTFFGDDHVENTANEWYTFTKKAQYMSMLGMKYTMADKTEISDQVPWLHMSDVTFLKRSWKPSGGLVYAPLDPDVIYDMPLWIKDNGQDPRLNTTRNCEAAAREMFHYGPEEFAVFKKDFNTLLKMAKCDHMSVPSWEGLLAQFLGGGFIAQSSEVEEFGNTLFVAQSKRFSPICYTERVFESKFYAQSSREPVEATTTEKDGLTTFEDATPAEVNKEVKLAYLPANPFQDVPVGPILSRLHKVHEFTWASTAPAHTEIDSCQFPKLLTNITINSQTLSTYRYMRSKLYIKCVLNTTAFHHGQLLVYWAPMNALSCKLKNTNSLYVVSANPCQILSATAGNSIEFEIPYMLPTLYWDMINYPVVSYPDLFCNMRFMVLSPLRALGSTANPSINITCYAKFVDPEVAGYLQIGATSEFRAQMMREQSIRSGLNTLQDIAKAVQPIAEKIEILPVIGSQVALLNGGMKFVGSLNQPTSTNNVTTVLSRDDQHQFFGGLSNALVLSTTPQSMVSTKYQAFGDPRDYNLLSNLGSIPSIVYLSSFNTSMLVGAKIMEWPVHPLAVATEDDTTFQIYYPTHLANYAKYFSLWRGPMKYKLCFITSKFVTCRVRLIWTTQHGATTDSGEGSVINHVIDIVGETEHNFSVPYLKDTIWSRCVDPNSPQFNLTIPSDHCNGYLSLYLVAQPKTVGLSATDTNVDVVLWSAQGEGFQVQRLTPGSSSIYQDRVTTGPTPGEFRAQSMFNPREDFQRQFDPIAPASYIAYVNVTTAENYTTVMDILRRPTEIEGIGISDADAEHFAWAHDEHQFDVRWKTKAEESTTVEGLPVSTLSDTRLATFYNTFLFTKGGSRYSVRKVNAIVYDDTGHVQQGSEQFGFSVSNYNNFFDQGWLSTNEGGPVVYNYGGYNSRETTVEVPYDSLWQHETWAQGNRFNTKPAIRVTPLLFSYQQDVPGSAYMVFSIYWMPADDFALGFPLAPPQVVNWTSGDKKNNKKFERIRHLKSNNNSENKSLDYKKRESKGGNLPPRVNLGIKNDNFL